MCSCMYVGPSSAVLTGPRTVGTRLMLNAARPSAIQDAQPLRIIGRRDLQPGGDLPVRGAHPEVALLEPLAGDAVVVGDLRQPDRAADGVAVGGGPDVAGPLAAGQHRLVAEQVSRRVVDDQADDAVAGRSLLPRLQQRVPADEPAGLVPRDREPEPGFDGV